MSDVLLPVAPYTETSGTFVNAEGRLQSFHAVVKPLGETRPAWKVIRVLANLLGLPGFAFDTSLEVLSKITGAPPGSLSQVPAEILNNQSQAPIELTKTDIKPCVASIYSLDGIVRRAASLQSTADARIRSLSPQAAQHD